MSKLLIPEPPLQVLPSLAARIGLNEAIVLQQVHYRGLQRDGWVEKSVGEWLAEFPFWSESTVKRVFARLRGELGLLESEKATRPLDQTNRYRVNEGALEALRSGQSDPMEEVNLTFSQIGSKRPDAPGQIEPVSIGKSEKQEEGKSNEPATTAEVFAVLTSVAARKRCASPGRDAVAKAITEFPKHDHLAVAKDLEFWALHGNGKRRQNMAIAQTYRNFLKRADPRPASTSSQPRSAYDQPAN